MKYLFLCFAFGLLACSSSDLQKDSAVDLHVMQDAVKGVNLKLDVTDFSFTPENVNQSNVNREGHAHLFIDGVKYGRVYGQWFYLGDVELGSHEFAVKLSNNDHSDMTTGGLAIQSGKVFEVMEGTMPHMHKLGSKLLHEGAIIGSTASGSSATNTTLALHVSEDAMSGYNLEVVTTGFLFTPENVNGENVAGSGHAHLYVDGVKVTRLYTSWYHLKALAAGDHEIKVTLSNNDHSDMTFDGGLAISSAVTITSTGTASTMNHDH